MSIIIIVIIPLAVIFYNGMLPSNHKDSILLKQLHATILPDFIAKAFMRLGELVCVIKPAAILLSNNHLPRNGVFCNNDCGCTF